MHQTLKTMMEADSNKQTLMDMPLVNTLMDLDQLFLLLKRHRIPSFAVLFVFF